VKSSGLSAAPIVPPIQLVHSRLAASAPTLHPRDTALANLLIAFQGAESLQDEAVTEAQRAALHDVAAFVSGLAVGGGSLADWGRLARMHADLRSHSDPKRLRVLQQVRTALASPDHENRAGNLLFGLVEWVDPEFGRLTNSAVAAELDSRGRRGVHAIAARLSIACGAFGDRGSEKTIASRYEKAERGLRESARSLSSSRRRHSAAKPRAG